MYTFSDKSWDRLQTCHPDIIAICKELIKLYDFSIIEGHRTQEEQMKYFREGKSTLDGITKKSKHQTYPSMAIDIMPYKAGTNAFSGNKLDTARFYFMMGLVRAISERLYEEGKIAHKVRFGIDWDNDDVYTDQNFHDCPHFELV